MITQPQPQPGKPALMTESKSKPKNPIIRDSSIGWVRNEGRRRSQG